MTKPWLYVSFAALCMSALAPAPAPVGDVHKDGRLGYQLKIPRDFKEIPLATGEEWIVAKFVSEDKDRVYDKDSGATWWNTPYLQVIAFLDEVINQPDVAEEEVEGEKVEVKLRWRNPFRDYEEYMKETYPGGFFIEHRETTTVNGANVECLDIKVNSRQGPDKRIATWIYETELGKIAVQFEVFDEYFDKRKGVIFGTLKSFKTIERTEGLDLESRTGAGFVSVLLLGELTPEQRRLRRQENERIVWKKMTEGAPEGWDSYEIDGVNVLSHSDKRHAKKVVERVKAIRSWLDDTFHDVGKDEYTRTPAVRLCSDIQEAQLFFSGTGGIGTSELVTYKDTTMGDIGDSWERVNRITMQMWFVDRDVSLWVSMPLWLRTGILRNLESADVRGKKLKFGESDVLRWLKQYAKSDPIPARSLMMFTRDDFSEYSDHKDTTAYVQCLGLVRFLVDDRKVKDVLPEYVTNLKAVIEEMDAEGATAEKPEKPETEEEEEELFLKRQARQKEDEKRVLQEAFDRTFGDWSESDWSNFERAYEKELK